MKFIVTKTITALLILSGLLACGSGDKTNSNTNNCVENIDLLPMYGSTPAYGSIEKCGEQLEADHDFLANCEKIHGSREVACLDYLEMGWHYLKQGDLETAMKRTNQAWNLDATNPYVYSTFAAILSGYADHEGALDMIDRSINMNANNLDMLDMMLTESISLYRQNKEDKHIKDVLKRLDRLKVDDDKRPRQDSIRREAEDFLKNK